MESDDDWVLLPDERAPATAPDKADNPSPPALPATAPAPAPEAPAAPAAPAADEDEVAPPPRAAAAVPGRAQGAAQPGADSLALAGLLMLAYCLFSALLHSLSAAWAPAVQRAAFGAAVATARPAQARDTASPYNASAFAPPYVFQGPAAPPLRPLRVTLPCAMCVADADAAACLDCRLAPFARYGQALRERRDVARLVLRHSHAAAGL